MIIKELPQCPIEGATILRQLFNPVFGADTACEYKEYTSGSRGHCACVALIYWNIYGGDMASTIINNESHWYNKIIQNGQSLDVDLTLDQYDGTKQVHIAPLLHPIFKIRSVSEINSKTAQRSLLLFIKAVTFKKRNTYE